jgi:Tfp pilus assembly protein PilO
MTNLAQLKKRFFTILGILAVIDLVLIVYLLWPGSSSASRKAQEQALQQQYRSLTHEVAPLKDIDQKLVQTRVDINNLYKDRIPNRWSEVSSELEKLMRESGVTSQNIHYTTDTTNKEELSGIQRVGIDTSITGEYGKIARFINALEQDKLLFIIKQISLNGQEGGTVTLQIKCDTFMQQSSGERAQS